MRQIKRASKAGRTRAQIVHADSIAERPAAVEDRSIPGHWEGDLITGAKNSCIATLVQRRSRFVQRANVPGKDTASVVTALIRAVRRLPAGPMDSQTWNRGLEMAQHHRFAATT